MIQLSVTVLQLNVKSTAAPVAWTVTVWEKNAYGATAERHAHPFGHFSSPWRLTQRLCWGDGGGNSASAVQSQKRFNTVIEINMLNGRRAGEQWWKRKQGSIKTASQSKQDRPKHET